MTALRARRRGGCGRTVGLLAGLVVLFALASGALWYLRSRPPAPAPAVAGAPPATAVPSPTVAPLPAATPRPSSVPSDFEPARGSGRGAIAVVIDDVGNADGSLERLARLDGPLAIAVLPGVVYRSPARRKAALASCGIVMLGIAGIRIADHHDEIIGADALLRNFYGTLTV